MRTLALSPQNILALSLALASAAILSGCSTMTTTAGTNPVISGSSINGKLHGGNQPVAGATVKLYAVGNTGYGSAGTLLATTTSANDASGSFAFAQVTTAPSGPSGNTYICPTSDTLLYIIADGGDTVGGGGSNNNQAAAFLAGIGPCGSDGNLFIDLNEVTTVASVFALAQYLNPNPANGSTLVAGSENIGSPNTTQALTGIKNAFATVPNLVTQSTGTAITSTTSAITSGTNMGSVTVTITPEAAKINTIANILASCVNNASNSASNCSSLFANAAPPTASTTSQPAVTFNTAVDTIQAAYYMATNPTNGSPTGLTTLFGLQAGAGAPFQSALNSAPSDWTIGVTYASNDNCTAGNNFLRYVYALSVDASGNVWMANGNGATSGLSEISPIGKPLNCSDVAYSTVRGGAAIDTAGNIWTTSNGTGVSAIYKYNGSTTTTVTVPSSGHSYGVAADGSSNIFFADPVNLQLFELPSTATSATVPTAIGAVASNSPYNIAVDTHGTVVVAQSGSNGNTITAYPTSTVGGTAYPTTGISLTQASYYAGVYGLAFDASGRFWIGNSAGTGTAPGNTTSATQITYTGNSGDPQTSINVTFAPLNATQTTSNAGGLSTGRWVGVDGAGNVWIANDATITPQTMYGVSEFTSGGTALSPTYGYQKAATVFAGLRGLAIDPSGNVWVSNTASTTNNWITEMIGAAVPVVTPISSALANGTLATKP